MTLPELAIRRHVTTLMILVSMVVLGGVALLKLPLAFMPDFEFPMLHVGLPYENASPSQIERSIVRPVEEALGSLKGLRNMWSHCGQDGGNIHLEFEWGTNLQVARTEAWERIDRIRDQLPDDLTDISVGTGWEGGGNEIPIMEGRLSSKRDLSESYDLLDRRIVKPLERVPGVANVRLDGVRPREVRINLRPADLERHRADIREVVRALRSGNFDQSLGKVTTGESRYALRTLATFTSIEEIRALPIRADGLRLSDVADAVYTEPPLEYGRHLDGDFAIGVTVTQESKANTVEVCRQLQERIDAMNGDPELQGVNFLVWFSQGREITKTLGDLRNTGVYGAILASIVLFFFLRRFATTVICIACIPFSLVTACGVVWAMGKTMNTLTMLGLIVGVGMLVDNAVVVLENIFRKREEGCERVTAALTGASEVSLAVSAATLTSIIVFLPLIFNKTSDESNVYLREIAIVISLTLLASLFISQTLIPLGTSWFIKAKPRPRGRWLGWLEDRHARLLGLALRRRWLSPLIGLLVTASAVYPFMKVDKNFGGSHSELFVQVNYDFSEELSLERKEEIVNRVEAALEPHREELMARSIYSFWSDHYAMTRIYLPEGRSNDKNMNAVRRALRPLLPEVAGVKLEIQETVQMWRPDRAKRIAFQLVGEDSEVLGALAEEAKRRLGEIPGLLDPFASSEEGQQEMHVELDRDLAARYGITPQQAADVVGLTFRGRRLQRFRTGDGEREMRLLLDEQRHGSLSQLHNLPLWTESGERVPLAALASFRQVPGADNIQRDNRRTSVWVGARYEEGSQQQYMPLIAAMANSLDFPPGYSWTFGQWRERQRESGQEFLTNLLLSLMLVFMVMAALFESARQAAALMVALPFALAGAAWTLFLTKTDFDSPAALGLLLLIGIVVNNGIVMIEHINMYRRQGVARHEAMMRGARERLRPIMMTATTTLIGLAPIAITKPSLGNVYYYSMALVIMGGLAISTVLTAVLLPPTASLAEDGAAAIGRGAVAAARWLRRPRLPRLRRPRLPRWRRAAAAEAGIEAEP